MKSSRVVLSREKSELADPLPFATDATSMLRLKLNVPLPKLSSVESNSVAGMLSISACEKGVNCSVSG